MTAAKLIRDRVPDLIRATGATPHTRVARPDEMRDLLAWKLREEVDEYLNSGDPAELADIAEVLYGLALAHRTNLDDLRMAKRRSHGGFGHRYVLLGVTTP